MLHWLPRNSSKVQKVASAATYGNEVYVSVMVIRLEDMAKHWQTHSVIKRSHLLCVFMTLCNCRCPYTR